LIADIAFHAVECFTTIGGFEEFALDDILRVLLMFMLLFENICLLLAAIVPPLCCLLCCVLCCRCQ